MSRSGIKRKLERNPAAIEAEFKSKLVVALYQCHAGRRELFGQNDHLLPRSPHAEIVTELLSLGEQISSLRTEVEIVEGVQPAVRISQGCRALALRRVYILTWLWIGPHDRSA